MWINVVRVDVGAREVTTRDMAATHIPHINPIPPCRPGVLPSHRPPAAYAFSATTATTTTSSATAPASPLPAECYLSPSPSAPPAEEVDTPLPVTPPSRFKRFKIFIKSANKERRKRDERTREAEEHTTTAHSRPRPGGSTPPTRRSFRLTGGAPDPGCGHARLPLWMEESNGATFPVELDSVVRGPDQDSSFEKRWDSMMNKSKIHSSSETQRPPGWDEVTHRKARVINKRSNFCPSIVIQEPSRAWPATSVNHKLPAPPASTRSRATGQQMHSSAPHHHNSLNMRRFSEQTDDIFPDDFLRIPIGRASSTPSLGSESSTSERVQLSASISDVAHQSSLTTHATHQAFSTSYSTQEDSSTSDVTHQPSSSSHVTQQDHSNSCRSQPLSITPSMAEHSSIPETEPPATSTTQHQSSSHASDAKASSSNTSDCHMWLSTDSFFCEDFTCTDAGRRNDEAAEYPQLEPHHSPSCPSMMQSESLATWTACDPEQEEEEEEREEEEEEELQWSASSSLSRLSGFTRACVSPSFSSDTAINTEATTLRVTDAPRRQHWVEFEGVPTQRWTPPVPPLVIVPSAPPADIEFSHVEAPLQPPSPPSVPSLAMPERPRSSPTHAVNYSGRLIRTYSQRGCRASKRVMNSVSRRLSLTEYGRLPESKPPMYSRAAMTMQTGPGLFEDSPTTPTESGRPAEKEEQFQPEELITKPTSSLQEPAAPRRVGSVRASRMTGALRRSLSLSSPHKKSVDVPFQKLSDQRPGSFRRALGALTRSFRKKSNSSNKPDLETNENASTTHGTQTPQAPRLPRRAARQTQAFNDNWDRSEQFV